MFITNYCNIYYKLLQPVLDIKQQSIATSDQTVLVKGISLQYISR